MNMYLHMYFYVYICIYFTFRYDFDCAFFVQTSFRRSDQLQITIQK